MKKILITGASGLVGQAVLSLLSSKEQPDVYAASSRLERIGHFSGNIHPINNSDVEALLRSERIDTLLQLAFPRNVSEEKWADGIRHAIDLLFLSWKYRVPRVINVSSQSIYGLQRTAAATESSPILLNSPYTTGKFCSEVVLSDLYPPGSYTSLRLSTVIGPTTVERVPNKLLANIIRGKDLIIKGGMQSFSFLDVRDAASGIVTLLENDVIRLKPAYNLGTDEAHTLLEIAELCLSCAKDLGFVTSRIQRQEANIAMMNQIDTSLFQTEFSWTAKYDLQRSIRDILQSMIEGSEVQ